MGSAHESRENSRLETGTITDHNATQPAKQIWFKLTYSGTEEGPFTEKEIQDWYRNAFFPSSTLIRMDDKSYVPLAQLRSHNGDFSPFQHSSEYADPMTERILAKMRKDLKEVRLKRDEAIARYEKTAAMVRSLEMQNVDLNKKFNEWKKNTGEKENSLSTKYTQVEARQFDVAKKLTSGEQSEGGRRGDTASALSGQSTVSTVTATNNSQQSKSGGIFAKKPVKAERVTPSSEPATTRMTRPEFYPMLQGSSCLNDYTASEGLFDMLRKRLEKCGTEERIRDTQDMFIPPPSCLLCGGGELSDIRTFVNHVLSQGHRDNIPSETPISPNQIYYWLQILDDGYTNRKLV